MKKKKVLEHKICFYQRKDRTQLRLVKAKNNFLREIWQYKTSFGYSLVLSFEHRHYTIESLSASDDGKKAFEGIHLEYKKDPFLTEDQPVYLFMIEFLKPKGCSMLYSREKEQLTLHFVRDLHEGELTGSRSFRIKKDKGNDKGRNQSRDRCAKQNHAGGSRGDRKNSSAVPARGN